MAIRFFVLTIFLFLSLSSAAQSTNDFMIGGGFDLLKTDNTEVFEKAQLGLEANYFVIRTFSVTAGVEIWTKSEESFAFGFRWYLMDNIYLRFRGLIGENDFSTGVGGAIPLRKNLRLEIMGDFYFEGEFAVRTGLAYILRSR
jgi:hypothetical protein